MPPTNPVAYGQSGADVEKLQTFLIGQGFAIPAIQNGSTKPGYFGDQTKQALSQWQQSVGISSATPGFGTNFGPLSMTAAAKVNSSKVPQNATPVPPTPAAQTPATQNTPKSSTSVSGPTPSPSSSTTLAPVNPFYAMVGATVDQIQQKASLGTPVRDFSQAMGEAAKDPRIVAKYGDMAKLDSQSFAQQLEQSQQLYSSEAEQRRTQFENERKQLAEQQAAAGTAYSGFRGKAQEDLAQTESGIVTSSRTQQQQFLNQLTSQFESRYGTGATPRASLNLVNPLQGNISPSGLKTSPGGINTLTGQQAGGITGTTPLAKDAEIARAAGVRYSADNPAPL